MALGRDGCAPADEPGKGRRQSQKLTGGTRGPGRRSTKWPQRRCFGARFLEPNPVPGRGPALRRGHATQTLPEGPHDSASLVSRMCVPKDALLKSLALEDGIGKVQVHVWTGHLGGRSPGHLLATQLGHEAAGVLTPSVPIHTRSGQCRGGRGWTPSGCRSRGKAVPTRCWHLDPHLPAARPAQPTPTPPHKPCRGGGERIPDAHAAPDLGAVTDHPDAHQPASPPTLVTGHRPRPPRIQIPDTRQVPTGGGQRLTTAPRPREP